MRWLDYAYLALFPRSRSFVDGWGDEAQIRMALDGRWSDIRAMPGEIEWTNGHVRGDARVRDGRLLSPARDLPLEARWAPVRLIEPRRGPTRGLAVVLPSWGDDTWGTRTRLFGPALERGLGILLLENPLYGSRRRVGQLGTGLRTVGDFVLMGRAIMQEALALLGWARDRYPRVGVAGYSMGGQMAALTASLSDEPVRVACVAPSSSPNSVFVDGPLRADIAWDRLGPGARPRLRNVMGALSVLSLPPPKAPESAVLIGTRRDAFVQPGDVGAIARHWGVHPRWLDDGHVSVVTVRARAVAQALVDAFA